MHIRDGFLSPEVCLGTGAIALGALAWSVRQLRNSLADRTVPLTGMTASLIFAGQMVNFALPPLPVSGHLLGGVLAGAVFCIEFWLSHRGQGYDFSRVFGWMVFLHCLIGIGEGLITAMVLGFVLVQRPDLLQVPSTSQTVLSGVGRFTVAGIVAALG